ncbi:MAG TPA: squalene/phytoene synthase family protein, partial [Burkholderiaceae bacterium]|nr:squalene/phytoene synthase family protein [Burkholderiaceae bacterium]
REAGHDAPILIHGALQALCDYHRARGIALGELRPATVDRAEARRLGGAIVIAPPSAFVSPWVQRFELQPRLLTDLLSAFEQDVTVHRFADRAALLDYCSRSANPVGRLMLQLFDRRDEAAYRASDAICSALQLINFAQDVARDWAKGRVYLPQQALHAAGIDDAVIGDSVHRGRADPRLAGVIAEEASFARRLLESGRPLLGHVPWRLAIELRAILAGGAHILDRLRAGGSDPIAQRPVIGRADAPAVLLKMFR